MMVAVTGGWLSIRLRAILPTSAYRHRPLWLQEKILESLDVFPMQEHSRPFAGDLRMAATLPVDEVAVLKHQADFLSILARMSQGEGRLIAFPEASEWLT